MTQLRKHEEPAVIWRLWNRVRVASSLSLFFMIAAFLGLFVLPLASMSASTKQAGVQRSQAVVIKAFRATLAGLSAIGLFRFDFRAATTAPPDGPLIIVANHPTTIDVVAVLAAYPHASVVVKRKLWKNPFLRRTVRWCGYIEGSDGTVAGTRRLLREAADCVGQGVPLVVFPEGTRSPDDGVGPLLKGAFLMASTTGAQVLPVTICCRPRVLSKQTPWYRWPSQPVSYSVTAGEPISSQGASARKLHAQVTAYYDRQTESGLL